MIQVIYEASATARLLQELLEGAEPSGFVNWTGTRQDPTIEDLPVLNWASRTNKLAQLVRLGMKEVPTPKWSPFPVEGWLPRTLYHQQGRDFTNPPSEPDFWVERLPLVEEWRLHFFRTAKGNLRLLRSGMKVAKPCPRVAAREWCDECGYPRSEALYTGPHRLPHAEPHPWVRSHRAGWKISYTGGAPPRVVEVGREALQALDLDFGAADLALDAEKSCYLLEVNTCPGLEAGTLKRYADSIIERLEA